MALSLRRVAPIVAAVALAACGGASVEAADDHAGSPATAPAAPAWLAGLEPGRVLRYEVRRGEEAPVAVALRVEQKLERGPAVAVYLVPEGPVPTNIEVTPRWLVGDDVGLSQITGDAGLPPLDARGNLSPGARSGTTLRLPGTWRGRSTQVEDRGWAIDELELRLEGEVRGDRCARFTQVTEEGERVVVVCARVGIVEEVLTGPDGRPLVRWRLSGAHRVDELRK